MRQCHQCGCDITPGEGIKRHVVVASRTIHSPQGNRIETQTEVVDCCRNCAAAIDEQTRQANRSFAIWGIAIFGIFISLVVTGYFLIVRPQMQEHERFRQKMEQDQEEFLKKHFGQ